MRHAFRTSLTDGAAALPCGAGDGAALWQSLADGGVDGDRPAEWSPTRSALVAIAAPGVDVLSARSGGGACR